jgi:tetratricopeptide (TPR) repeat protein
MLWKYEKEMFVKNKKVLFACIGFFVFMALSLPKGNVDGYSVSPIARLKESISVHDASYAPSQQRKLIWSCAWDMVCDSPVLGKGFGCFELFYPYYQAKYLFLENYRALRTHANNAHNEILEICSQTGIMGLGIYLWLLVSIFLFGLQLIKNSQGEKRLISICLWTSIIGMWVDNLLNVSLHFATPAFLYWWNVGLLVGIGRLNENIINLKAIGKKLFLWLLIIFGLLIMIRYYNEFVAEKHAFLAIKSQDLRESIDEFEQSKKFQKFDVNNNYELANCYARYGILDKAIENYHNALSSNCGYDEIYFNMAAVFARQGRLDDAVAAYSKSLLINPDALGTYLALARLYRTSGKYDKAYVVLMNQCCYFYPKNAIDKK